MLQLVVALSALQLLDSGDLLVLDPGSVPVLMYWQCIGLVASFVLVTRVNQKTKARSKIARQPFQNLLYFPRLKLQNVIISTHKYHNTQNRPGSDHIKHYYTLQSPLSVQALAFHF